MNYENTEEKELELRDLWLIIRQRRALVLAVFGLIFVIGTGWLLFQKPLYEGKATLIVEGDRFAQMNVFSGIEGSMNPLETEMEILKSRTIAERVVRELGFDVVWVEGGLAKQVRFKNFQTTQGFERLFAVKLDNRGRYKAFTHSGKALGEGILSQPFVGNGVQWELNMAEFSPGTYWFRKVPFQDAVRTLRGSIAVVEAARNTNVIQVTSLHHDPTLARDIANEVVEAYLAVNVARKGQEATQVLEFIEHQIETIRGNIEKGEVALDEFKSNKGIFVLSETAHKLIGQISSLELDRANLEISHRLVSHLADELAKAGNDEAPYILGSVSFPDSLATQLIGSLSKRIIELRAIRESLTDDNPQVVAIKAELDENKAKIRLAVKNAQMATEHRLKSIDGIIGSFEEQLRGLPQAERQLASITRNSQVNADLYTFLLKKHEEARIARAGIVANVRVLDPALLPDTPVSPQVNQSLLIILFTGIIGGLGLAFAVDYFDDSIKGTEQVEKGLGLSVYGVIPYAAMESESTLALHRLDAHNPILEAFRSLRTNISFSSTEGPMKTILCTSALPGAGKTTLNVNLSIALAQGGYRVLLIDCDLRRPQVHQHFDLAIEPGLTNALSSKTSWREIVMHAENVNKNLYVLPTGIIPPNPAEFLGSPKFKAFLKEAYEEYDYILIDIPPVVVFTDAAVVASMVDAVFIVVDIGHSRLVLVKRALDLLRNVKANVKGALVNKMKWDRAYEGQYYYSYYYQNQLSEGRFAKILRIIKQRLLG